MSRLSPFFRADCLAVPSAVREPGASGVQRCQCKPECSVWDQPQCHLRYCHRDGGTGGCTEGAKQGSWAWGVQNQPALGTQIWAGRRLDTATAPWTIAAVSPS